MQPIGIILIVCGAYELYCAVKGLPPITTAKALIANPGSASTILTSYESNTASQGATTQLAADDAATGQSTSSSSGLATSGNASQVAAQTYAQSQLSKYGWGADQWQYLLELWERESGWRVNAYNASSGATGIPQALPGSKMASAGSDYLTNPDTQITWGLGYIKSRYGSPQAAWQHEESYGWY